MRHLSNSLKDIFPIVLSDGYIGAGINSKTTSKKPYFYAKGFDAFSGDKTWGFSNELYFQPKHFYKYESDRNIEKKKNSIISSNTFPSDVHLCKTMTTFINEEKQLQKIVLAQQKTYTFENFLDPYCILSKLTRFFPENHIFAYIPNSNTIFFGSSPECLYTRIDDHISVDCIAATESIGNEKNLYSQKHQKEHRFVTSFVMENLKKIAGNIQQSDIEIKTAEHLIHLYQTVTGTLLANTTDLDIISELHPTPATLGYPRELAYIFLKQQEKFDRGLYAGCLGWMNTNHTKLRVAIRSGILKNNTLTLFAGAGITKESDQKQEIEEIKNKFKTLEGVFLE